MLRKAGENYVLGDALGKAAEKKNDNHCKQRREQLEEARDIQLFGLYLETVKQVQRSRISLLFVLFPALLAGQTRLEEVKKKIINENNVVVLLYLRRNQDNSQDTKPILVIQFQYSTFTEPASNSLQTMDIVQKKAELSPTDTGEKERTFILQRPQFESEKVHDYLQQQC